jgi:serine protease Do
MVAATPKAGDVFVRADIRLVPGNSGGPLADAEGKVVGINSMVVDGFGIAVSSTAVRRFVSELA